MKSDKYSELFTKEHLMGPNSMRLLEELCALAPEALNGARVLDLGCGRALTSLYLARETGARQIFATDLWISATDNYADIERWREDGRIVPIHADAHELPYANGYFDVMTCVDSYHYYGCADGFFGERILPLVRRGGYFFISMPGLRSEFDGDIPELMTEWAQEEAYMFHSADRWRSHLTECGGTEVVFCGESRIFDETWNDWFASRHEYAQRDREFFDRGLAEYINFVNIILRKL